MLYKTLSAAVYGIDASIIEVDVSGIRCDKDNFCWPLYLNAITIYPRQQTPMQRQ
jgi:hypothetical protein